MPKIDQSVPFQALNIAVLTVSDSRTEKDDKSGDLIAEMLIEAGHTLADKKIAKDDVAAIQAQIRQWIADNDVNVVITTGGTGFTGRDITPEAVKPLFDKEIDGFSTIFHMLSYDKVGTSTIQSRACAGLAESTLIFAVPGSPGACKDAWQGILQYQLDIRHRPCNFIEIMPRFMEQARAPGHKSDAT